MASAGRILIIVENLPVPFDRRVWQESTSLTEAGFTVSVICPKGKGYSKSYEIIDGVHIFRYSLPIVSSNSRWGYLWEYFVALLRSFVLSISVAIRPGFDVIHACNPPDLLFMIGAFWKLYGKKFVFDPHDLCPETYQSRFERSGSVVYMALRFLERCTYKLSNMVISTNESYRQVAMARGEVPRARTVVVRSGPRADRFKPVAPNPELKRGKRYLGCYLGVMGPQDGVDYLLHAIRHAVVVRGRRDIHFALIGSGDMLPKLKEMAVELEINDAVEFTGRIPDADVMSYFSTAEVCLSPDPLSPLNDKSTMNKVLEYMALGKPIVSFELKEARVSAADAAVYVTPNDTREFADVMIDLFEDEERRLRMGAIGRERIEDQLSWEHSRRILVGAYSSLLSTGQLTPNLTLATVDRPLAGVGAEEDY